MKLLKKVIEDQKYLFRLDTTTYMKTAVDSISWGSYISCLPYDKCNSCSYIKASIVINPEGNSIGWGFRCAKNGVCEL